jgi:hypothetical protein
MVLDTVRDAAEAGQRMRGCSSEKPGVSNG